MTLNQWIINNRYTTVVCARIKNGGRQVLVDGRAWFAPQWKRLPLNVEVTDELWQHLLLENGRRIEDDMEYWQQRDLQLTPPCPQPTP